MTIGTPLSEESQSSVDESDPLAGDVEDESQLQRRAVWLETAAFGDVFARVVGQPSDPLILYVHGSGTASNSVMLGRAACTYAFRA